MHYFLLPDSNCIARVPKTASRSIARAIVTNFYPELMENYNNLLPEAERFADDSAWLALAPQSETPQGIIYAAIRDPVERFLSACAMMNTSIEDGLKSTDMHFLPQSDFVKNAKTYLLPDNEKEFCAATKLPYPLPIMGKGRLKPLITEKQREEILLFKSF